jgi:hypothetical protein
MERRVPDDTCIVHPGREVPGSFSRRPNVSQYFGIACITSDVREPIGVLSYLFEGGLINIEANDRPSSGA